MKYFTILLIITFQSNIFSQYTTHSKADVVDSTKISIESVKFQSLQEVTVTANFQETEIRKAARNISVITARQIELSPAKTLDGILQYALNVDVRSRGPLGVQADISIRGGHYDQTLIMLDGVKLNDPQTGHHSLNLPVSLEMIERIEVLQGGGSRVYGPAAFSGVINIITKKNQPTQANLGYAFGEHGLKKLNFGGSLNFKGKTITMGLEQIKSNGFAKNTAFDRSNIFLNTRFGFGKNTDLSLSVGAFKNNFGASNYYSPAVYTQYEEVSSKLAIAQMKHSIGQNFNTSLTASFRQHNDMYDFDNYRKTKPNSINFHQTDVYDISWSNKLQTKLGTTSLGLEWRSEGVISNRLGEALAVPKLINGSKEHYSQELFYTKSKARKNTSAYFEQWKQWDKTTLSIGSMVNFNSQFGTDIFPGIDLSYSLNPKTSIYSSLNRSLRFPTFTEMYLVGATVKGDPNLKPEDAWSFEIGSKRNTPITQITASIFYKRSNAAIDKIKRPELPVPTMETIGNMNSYGLEISYALNINKLQNNDRSILQRIQMNYAYINSNKKEENYQSFYTLNYLKNKASFGLNWRIAKNIRLDTWYTYKQRMGSYQLNASTLPVKYVPINLVDARLSYQQKYFRLFVDGTNLLNKKYYEFGYVEQPKRWMSTGIAINIK